MTQRLIASVSSSASEAFRRELRHREQWILDEQLDQETYLLSTEEPAAPLSYFCRHHFPVQRELTLEECSLHELLQLDLKEQASRLADSAYAVQWGANLKLEWKFGDIVRPWIERQGLKPELFSPRKPERVWSLFVQRNPNGNRLFSGVSSSLENLSSWSGGRCRIPRDPDAISRAESKLREALECAELHGLKVDGKSKRAVDLGAAPGGWSRVLASLGYVVDAVDPALLDPRLSESDRVVHHRTTAGDFFRQGTEDYQVLVCDMKMSAVKAAETVVAWQERLNPGGLLVLTLKLGKGPSAFLEVDEALQVLEPLYRVRLARQLYFNRNEITVVATVDS